VGKKNLPVFCNYRFVRADTIHISSSVTIDELHEAARYIPFGKTLTIRTGKLELDKSIDIEGFYGEGRLVIKGSVIKVSDAAETDDFSMISGGTGDGERYLVKISDNDVNITVDVDFEGNIKDIGANTFTYLYLKDNTSEISVSGDYSYSAKINNLPYIYRYIRHLNRFNSNTGIRISGCNSVKIEGNEPPFKLPVFIPVIPERPIVRPIVFPIISSLQH